MDVFAVIEHLTQDGLTESRNFLAWLGQEDIDIGVIDDAVLRRFRRRRARTLKMLAGRSRQFASSHASIRLRIYPAATRRSTLARAAILRSGPVLRSSRRAAIEMEVIPALRAVFRAGAALHYCALH